MKPMALNTNENVPPVAKNGLGYKEIVGQIGQQLKDRQGLIAKRVAFISLPLIISATCLIYANNIGDGLNLSGGSTAVIAIIGLVTMVFTFPWAIIMGQIFKIERLIWIDSFFDNEKLDNKQSWKMAKKLFFPSVKLDILIFLKYYLLAILAALGLVAGYFALIAADVFEFNVGIFILMIILLPILVMIYSYFVKIRLRYVPFLLIDTFGSESFSTKALLKESKELNKVMKSDEFKKMLVTILGAEVLESAVNTIIGTMSGASSRAGGVAGAAGAASGMYASEVVAVIRSYAQIVVYYIYYRVARQLKYGAAQVKNETLYKSITENNSITNS